MLLLFDKLLVSLLLFLFCFTSPPSPSPLQAPHLIPTTPPSPCCSPVVMPTSRETVLSWLLSTERISWCCSCMCTNRTPVWQCLPLFSFSVFFLFYLAKNRTNMQHNHVEIYFYTLKKIWYFKNKLLKDVAGCSRAYIILQRSFAELYVLHNHASLWSCQFCSKNGC